MNEGLIARRYAKALYSYAVDLGVEELVYHKMKTFLDNYLSHPHLQTALLNPVLSVADKEQLLSTAIGIDPDVAYIGAIRLLLKHHRERHLKTIALLYRRLYRQAKNIVRVRIVAAAHLSPESLDRIKTLVRQTTTFKPEFSVTIDDTLIGGFILNIDSRQLDLSVCCQLKQMQRELLGESR